MNAKKISLLLLVLFSLTAYSQTAEEYIKKGSDKFNLEDYVGAITEFTEAIKVNPSSEWAYSFRAEAHTKLGDYEAALKDYDTLVELNPEVILVYYNRGTIRQILGYQKEGCQDWKKAKEMGHPEIDDLLTRYCN